MPTLKHPATATLGRLLLLFSLLMPAARAHSTVAIDQNTSSLLSSLGNQGGSSTGPLLVHSMVTVRLRADDTQVDITIADSAAYQLLEQDPYAPSPNPATGNDPHFARDQPLLMQCATELLTLTNNNQTLTPLAAAVELTTTQDIIFHLTYPPIAPGQLHLQARYIDKIPASQRILVEVLDRNLAVIAYTGLGADNPAMDVAVAAPSTAAPPAAKPGLLLEMLGAILGAAGLFLLIGKLRRQPPPARD